MMAQSASERRKFKCPRTSDEVAVAIPLEHLADEFCGTCHYPMFWAPEVIEAAKKHAAADKAAAEKAVAEKPAPDKPAADKAVAEKPAPDKPAVDKGTTEAPSPAPMDVPHPTVQHTVHPWVWVFIGLLLIVVMISLAL